MLSPEGLLLCAVSILMQIAGGADYPTVPPGAVITAAAGLIVLFVSSRYIVILGLLVAAFITFGAFAAPDTAEHLAEPGEFLVFLGSVVQIAALAVAVIGGLVATVRAFRRSPAVTPR
ncbi:hypothetical protein [Actinoplanes sp. NPDC049802]|uniref:hypothetical protein n=1 Tax=Actinoplanes sp. NPDC049802 TaxID=3154742 RepID=UPI0033D25501